MKWNLREVDGTASEKQYKVGILTGKLLALSNCDEAEVQEVLSGDMHLSYSRADCLIKACQRIQLARERHEKVFVGGDYDADGVCSTAIMKATLDALHIPNGYYIPDRFKEGYGLSAATVEKAAVKGYTLIITVDNGVKAHEALKKAQELGIDVIVSDHHTIDEEIEAEFVVHPDYMESEFAYLSGAGVALEISRNLIGNRDDLNALAGVAAIGDVMPYHRETRKLIKNALSLLARQIPPSLSSLLAPGSQVDETAVSFSIVPKLNSVGRMNDISNVNTVVRFLLSSSEKNIAAYRVQLERVNDARKAASEAMSKKAMGMLDDEPMQILYDPDFYEGVCGLAAGRIANEIHKPVLVLSRNGNLIKGSGRSIPGFDMFSFFADFDMLKAFGGHKMAVGLSIEEKDYEAFRTSVREKLKTYAYEEAEEEHTAIVISRQDVTFANINNLNVLSPYPKDFAEPYFCVNDIDVFDKKETAKMIRYHIGNRAGGFDAVYYKRKGLDVPAEFAGLIGTLNINRWRERVTPQLVIEDFIR